VSIEERCSGRLLAENTSENALPSRTSVFSLWSMRDRLQLRTAIMENWGADLRTIVREALKRNSMPIDFCASRARKIGEMKTHATKEY
jgi:hypothetical protein